MDFLEALQPSWVGPERKPYDPRPRLFPAALRAYDDPRRHRAWIAGRGSGKTTTGEEVLLETALRVPECTVIYMSNTIDRAKAVVWAELVRWAAPFGGSELVSDLVIRFPGASRLFVSGADSLALFDRKKGIKNIALVLLDEAQDWQSEVLEYAVTQVFMPRLGDLEARHGVKGRIIVAGAGGRDSGYWHDICTRTEMGFGASAWTQWDNPHIADPDGEFREACKASKATCLDLVESAYSPGGRLRLVDSDDPGMRRQWFAEFNSGGALQIFPVAQARLVRRADLPTRDIRLVIGADFGTLDACAAVCWLFTQHDSIPYCVRASKEYGLSGNRQIRFVRQFAAACADEYKPIGKPFISGDGGGLGKALVMDLQEAEGGWEVDAAEKQDKVPNIRIMAGDMRDGSFAVCDDLHELMDELKLPEWHGDHVGERIQGHVPDQVDAAYLGYRKVKEQHRYVPPLPPEDPEDVLERRIQAQIKAGRERWENPYA